VRVYLEEASTTELLIFKTVLQTSSFTKAVCKSSGKQFALFTSIDNFFPALGN
jgi:hypothetical protein